MFDGFGSLTSLFLKEIMTSTKTLLHLLSNCPLLKTLELNLVQGIDVSAIVHLFQCLPVIENLSIWFQNTEGSGKGGVPLALPTALGYLKNLAIESLSFIHRDALPFLLLLIKSSLNLEKLKIEMIRRLSYVIEAPFTLKNSPDIWLERLYELEVMNMFYRKTELDLVKLILANAPVLKKVWIFLCSEVARDEELQISELLLCSPHASPVAEIIVEVVEISDTSSSRSVMPSNDLLEMSRTFVAAKSLFWMEPCTIASCEQDSRFEGFQKIIAPHSTLLLLTSTMTCL